MRKTTGRMLALCMAVALLTGLMTTGLSAGEKTKTFSLKSGDSMILSNYVDERTETLTINGEEYAVTYYLVDQSTKITFNMTSDKEIGGDILLGYSEGPSEFYAEFDIDNRLGSEWGWPESYTPWDDFPYAYQEGDQTISGHYGLTGIKLTNWSSHVETDEGWVLTDSLMMYTLRRSY